MGILHSEPTVNSNHCVVIDQKKLDLTILLYSLFYNCIPYRMKLYTEFNLATWLRLVKFTDLNISEF